MSTDSPVIVVGVVQTSEHLVDDEGPLRSAPPMRHRQVAAQAEPHDDHVRTALVRHEQEGSKLIFSMLEKLVVLVTTKLAKGDAVGEVTIGAEAILQGIGKRGGEQIDIDELRGEWSNLGPCVTHGEPQALVKDPCRRDVRTHHLGIADPRVRTTVPVLEDSVTPAQTR